LLLYGPGVQKQTGSCPARSFRRQGRHWAQRFGREIHHPGCLRLPPRRFEFLLRQSHVESIPTRRSCLRLERIVHLVPFMAKSRQLATCGQKISFDVTSRSRPKSRLTSASRCSKPGIASRVLILIVVCVSCPFRASTAILSGSDTCKCISVTCLGRAVISLGAG